MKDIPAPNFPLFNLDFPPANVAFDFPPFRLPLTS